MKPTFDYPEAAPQVGQWVEIPKCGVIPREAAVVAVIRDGKYQRTSLIPECGLGALISTDEFTHYLIFPKAPAPNKTAAEKAWDELQDDSIKTGIYEVIAQRKAGFFAGYAACEQQGKS